MLAMISVYASQCSVLYPRFSFCYLPPSQYFYVKVFKYLFRSLGNTLLKANEGRRENFPPKPQSHHSNAMAFLKKSFIFFFHSQHQFILIMKRFYLKIKTQNQYFVINLSRL